MKAAVWSEFPDLPIPDIYTLEHYFNGLIAQRHFNMLLLGLFGLLGIIIAGIGIYGVMAYVVTQRTQEIGIRMALGAVPSAILWSVLGRASLYLTLGLAIGATWAWGLARFVEGFLFEIQPHDLTVYLARVHRPGGDRARGRLPAGATRRARRSARRAPNGLIEQPARHHPPEVVVPPANHRGRAPSKGGRGHAMRLFAFWEQLLQDVRYAVRVLARQPLFTAMAVLSLALGIGANTAIYSFMDAILLRALPVRNPESLVVLNWHGGQERPAVVHGLSGSNFKDPKTGYTSGNFPFPAFELLRANSPQFASVFAFNGAGRLTVLVQGQADLANGQYVSGGYFSGLGVLPAAGRLIDAADDRAGAPPIVVLGFGYAQRRFGDVSGAPGQSILINGTPFTVAGVAAPEFFGVNPAGPQDLYLPMRELLSSEPAATSDPHRYWVEMMGRLRPGVTIEQGQTELAQVFRNFVESTAATDKERTDLPTLYLQEGAGGLDFLRRQYSRPLYVLMTMVGLILAIACANIANLLLARATARRREMALRLSLGAGRLRVVRQLLTESVLLASLGGLLGLVFAGWGIRAITLLIGNGRENFTLHATLNWNVLAITIALSFATGLIFGLAPALQSTRVDLNTTLKQTGAGPHGSGSSAWFRIRPSQLLVVSQIAISLLLLVGAGLFVRTLANLTSIALGFNGERVLLFTVNAKQAGYADEGLVRFYQDLQARLKTIPDVRNVSSSNVRARLRRRELDRCQGSRIQR